MISDIIKIYLIAAIIIIILSSMIYMLIKPKKKTEREKFIDFAENYRRKGRGFKGTDKQVKAVKDGIVINVRKFTKCSAVTVKSECSINIYDLLKDVYVKENDQIKEGQIIGRVM